METSERVTERKAKRGNLKRVNQEEAHKFIGQSRIRPADKFGEESRHTCVRVTGVASLTAGQLRTNFGQIWMTGYSPGNEMWCSIETWESWAMAEATPGICDHLRPVNECHICTLCNP